MADVIGSRNADQRSLMDNFKQLISYVNKKEKEKFLSPMTITLGDEFQSVVKSLPAAIGIILKLEETMIITKKRFKLRYVLEEGEIETEINRKIAYEMLGSGLTTARETLGMLKAGQDRFHFNLTNNKKGTALNKIFYVLQDLIDHWKIEKDYDIVSGYLRGQDYKEIATQLNKDRSLIWKRSKSLKIREFFALKEVIKYIGEDPNA